MSRNISYLQGAVGKKEISLYALAGGGQVFGYSLVWGYLMYFYINILRVDPKIVSLMLLIEGIWDIVNNPLAGLLIDRGGNKKEKMTPYLRRLSAPLGLFTVLLFAGPFLIGGYAPNSAVKAVYIFVTYFLWEMCYTVTDVAYWGLSAAISPSPDDRAKVAKSVNIFQTVAESVPFVIVPILIDLFSATGRYSSLKYAFFILGLIAAAGVGLFSLSGFFVKERVHQTREKASLKESLHEIIANPLLRALMLANLASIVRGVGNALTTYYYADVLGNASLSILVQVPGAVAWLFSYRILALLKKHMSNKKILTVIPLVIAACYAIPFTVGFAFYDNAKIMMALILPIQTVIAAIATPYTVVYNEMLAEATDYTQWRTGMRNEGLSFSVKIASEKASGTISQSVGSAMLSALGYQSPVGDLRQPQTVKVKRGIWSIYLLALGLGHILAALPMLACRYSEKDRQTVLTQLAERRNREEDGEPTETY